MNQTFIEKFRIFQKWINKYMWATGAIILTVGICLNAFDLTGGLALTIFGASILILALLANSIWFVPTAFVGYKQLFGRLSEESYSEGLHWIVPFFTDTYLMDIAVQTRTINDTKKVRDRNDILLECTLTYQLDERYVHILFRHLRETYYSTHLSRWIDAVFDTYVSTLTYPEFQLRKAEIEQIASKLIKTMVDEKCEELTKDMGLGMRNTTRYQLVTKYEEKPDPTDPTGASTIFVPVMLSINENGEETLVEEKTCEEYFPTVEGINFFKSIDLKINRVKFEAQYEEARAKVAVARAEAEEELQKKKRMEIEAEAKKNVRILEAQAEAEYKRQIGASENEVKEKLGEILKTHPELLKEVLAKNFPKVFGGNTMINLNDLLGD